MDDALLQAHFHQPFNLFIPQTSAIGLRSDSWQMNVWQQRSFVRLSAFVYSFRLLSQRSTDVRVTFVMKSIVFTQTETAQHQSDFPSVLWRQKVGISNLMSVVNKIIKNLYSDFVALPLHLFRWKFKCLERGWLLQECEQSEQKCS